MQDRKVSLSIEFPRTNDRKATLAVAFRWFPVALSFLLCTLCVSFMAFSQPASATLLTAPDQPGTLSSQIGASSIIQFSTTGEEFLSSVFTKEVLYWEKEILYWAETYHLDPNLVAVVMQIESCGHPNVESRSGARGLFQVMPFHFSENENPLDADTNAYRGLSYLAKSMIIADEDPALALAGYNGGHGIISIEQTYWPDETKRYVYWGSGILKDIESSEIQSSRLNEWLLAGGASLCNLSSAELGL